MSSNQCVSCGCEIPEGMMICKPCMEGEKIVDNTVDHPTHYNREGSIECIEEMRLVFGDYETSIFCKLNAWKYRYRAYGKNGLKDIEKSDWYMRFFKFLKGLL